MKTYQQIVRLLKKNDLLLDYNVINQEIEIKTITYDSRQVTSQTLFFVKGAAFKQEYLFSAIENGATVIVSEKRYDIKIPQLIVRDVRRAMVHIAHYFYNYPSQDLKMTGITGTKGKTSVVYFLKNIFDTELKKKTAFLSSINSYDGTIEKASELTTPEALELVKSLKNANDAKCEYFTMEVSSQALKYNRSDQIIFDVGAFLNIGTDHISEIEHPDFQDYFNSKLLFSKQCKNFVVNLDICLIDTILESIPEEVNLITVSLVNPEADYYVSDILQTELGYTFSVNHIPYEIQISGLFNVENAAVTIAIANTYGISQKSIQEGLRTARVNGRMEYFISTDKQVKVLVDYAHNELSFEKLFSSCKERYKDHELILIFGCPGNKAKNRRIELPRVANKYIDVVYLTMEDPGYETVRDISLETQQYLTIKNYIVDNREEAFKTALENAKKPTLILFTGKGDEKYHKIKDHYVPMISDVEIVNKYLK